MYIYASSAHITLSVTPGHEIRREIRRLCFYLYSPSLVRVKHRVYLGRLASILLCFVESGHVPNRLMIGFLVLYLRWGSGLPIEWERVSYSVHLEVRVGSSGSKDEKEFGKTGLSNAASFFSLTLLNEEFLGPFSAAERGLRQGMMDAHSSLLDSSVR